MTFDHEEAMERLRAFNAGFKQPMTDNELDNCVSSAKKKDGYKYTNVKLIELLNVTQEEQNAVGLHPFRGIYRPWGHTNPNASRDAARRAIREDRDHKILALHEQGVSQAETARRLGVGKNTVGRVLKKLLATAKKEDATPKVIVRQEERHQNGSIYVLLNNATAAGVSTEERHSDRGLFVLPKSREPNGYS